jgi:hypothetical protein
MGTKGYFKGINPLGVKGKGLRVLVNTLNPNPTLPVPFRFLILKRS